MNIERRESGTARTVGVVLGACIVVAAGALAFRYLPAGLLPGIHVTYGDMLGSTDATSTPTQPIQPLLVITHLATPSAVKAVYMTACVAGSKNIRDRVLAVMKGTEINSLVIDIKDYTGTLSYVGTRVPTTASKGCRISDLPQFLAELHVDGLYTIGRITVFQDPLYAGAHPEIAVGSYAHPGKPWTDKNGLAYVDPDFPAYWDRIVDIAKEAHSIGFDEINFDYIRFPSDGDMSDAHFAIPTSTPKWAVITDFFAYLRSQLEPAGVIMSADIFGQTTVNYDDLGIGQILEDALPYFDYVAPMIYPSHFIKNFEGYANPADHPYEIVNSTMISAVERAVAASSTPDKLRPWLQAFDLGAVYTPDMVKKQVQAVYDAGLTSWMLWNAANVYNKEAL